MSPEMLRLLLALGVEPPRADATEAEIVGLCMSKVGQIREEAKRNALELAGRADSAGRDRDAEKARADAAERAKADADKALAAEKGRADAAEAELAKLRQAEQERADAAERKDLEALAKSIKVDPKRHDGLPALRVACATAIYGAALPQNDDGYVNGILSLGLRRMREHADSAGREAGRLAWQPAQDGEGAEGGSRGDSRQQPAQRSGMARRWLESATRSGEAN